MQLNNADKGKNILQKKETFNKKSLCDFSLNCRFLQTK